MEDDSEGGAAPDPLLKAVADRIEALREESGMEPAELARQANFTLQYFWRLRTGRMNLTLRSISRIALALGVPMASLLEGVEADPSTLRKRPYGTRQSGGGPGH